MPYDGPSDPGLPQYVASLSEDERSQWVSIFNRSYEDCVGDGGDASSCEGVAFRNANGVVLNIQHVAANVVGEPHKAIRDGREWMVFPMVAVKAGVLNGELAQADEIKKYVAAWNDRPFVLGHPQDQDGNYISAGDPRVLELLGLGRVYNAEWAPDIEGIRAETWLDVGKLQALGGKSRGVLERLESGAPLEVSTAYFRDLEEGAGVFNGREYDGIQRNIRPDHVAALPDGTGACSWIDGCGAPRVNMQQPLITGVANLRSTARTPEYSGTTTGEWSAPSLGDFGFDSIEDMSDDEKADVAATSLLGDAGADNFRELLFFPVVEPSSRNLSERALRAVIGGRAAQADIPQEAIESARRKAYQLLNDEFDADLDYEPLGNESTEEEMDELVQEILEANAAFTEEMLEGYDEAQLEAILSVAQNMPAQTPPEEHPEGNEDTEDDEGEEPQTNATPLPTTDPEMSAWLDSLRELGGAAEVSRMLGELRANTERERAVLVNELDANSACLIDRAHLEAMSIDALKQLRASFEGADYSGMGFGTNIGTDEQDEIELPMPSLWDK